MPYNDILSGFRVQSTDPIDSRLVCADLATRDAIPAAARYEGLQTYVVSEQKVFILQGGVEDSNFINITDAIQGDFLTLDTVPKDGESGYSRTSAFAGKPASNNYNWEASGGIVYSTADVAAGNFKVLSLDPTVHTAVDNPYWTVPTPTGNAGIGLFQGANLPEGVNSLVDYSYVYNDNYDANGSTGFEGSTGRIDLSDCRYGDQLRVRFDFNIIPQIANTTVEPALWYSNRNDNNDITFTFPLTTQPIFYGTGTVGNTYLNRVEISAWITSNEDVNALTLPAIKSDNQVIIQPLGLLITIIR